MRQPQSSIWAELGRIPALVRPGLGGTSARIWQPVRTATDDSAIEIIAAETHDRSDTDAAMPTSNSKPLQPPLPPGHGNRKALAYTSEIQRLRRLGYSFDAIRLALLDVGVAVGLSTVKREAAREIGAVFFPPTRPTFSASVEPDPATPAQMNACAPMSPRRTGKDIAEAFAQSHISHPLLKTQPESTQSENDPR